MDLSTNSANAASPMQQKSYKTQDNMQQKIDSFVISTLIKRS